MANTIATAWGYDSTRVKETHRLGSQRVKTQAATWRTFVTVEVDKTGSVWLMVKRDGNVVHEYHLDPELNPCPKCNAMGWVYPCSECGHTPKGW